MEVALERGCHKPPGIQALVGNREARVHQADHRERSPDLIVAPQRSPVAKASRACMVRYTAITSAPPAV